MNGKRKRKRLTATDDRRVFPRARRLRLTSVFVISAVILAGLTARAGEQMPDFARLDVNSTSTTYGHMVSPHDYEGKVSGWYFGHAT